MDEVSIQKVFNMKKRDFMQIIDELDWLDVEYLYELQHRGNIKECEEYLNNVTAAILDIEYKRYENYKQYDPVDDAVYDESGMSINYTVEETLETTDQLIERKLEVAKKLLRGAN